MRFLFFLCVMGFSGDSFAQGPMLPIINRQLEDVASDLRVIGVLREVSSNPIGIAVLRKVSDGTTLYLKEGASYKGMKLKRVERGRVVLGLNASQVQIEPVSEADEQAKEADELTDVEDLASEEKVSEKTWNEIDSMVGAKVKKERTQVSSADDFFEVGEKREEKNGSDEKADLDVE